MLAATAVDSAAHEAAASSGPAAEAAVAPATTTAAAADPYQRSCWYRQPEQHRLSHRAQRLVAGMFNAHCWLLNCF